MNVTLPQEALNSLLKTAGRAIAANPAQPILRGVLLAATPGALSATGYDLATGITAASDAVVEAPGAVVAPHRLLSDLVGRLPALAVTLRVDGAVLRVTCGAGEYQVPLEGDDVAEWPELPEVGELGGTEITLEPLAKALSLVAGFVAKESDTVANPVVKGLGLVRRGNDIELVGGTGPAFALARLPGIAAGDGLKSCVVPLDAVRDVAGLSGEVMDVSSDGTVIQFSAEAVTVTSNLIAGSYPPVRSLMPNSYSKEIAFDRDALRAAVERVALFSGTERTCIVMEVGDVEVSVRAEHQSARGVDVVGCLGGPEEPFVIGFDGNLLVKVLRACPGRDVTMLANGAEQLTVWKVDELTEFLLMPMKVVV